MTSIKPNLEKREKLGILSMAILNGLFINFDAVNIGVRIFRAISGFALWSIIVIIAVNFLQKDTDKLKMNMKTAILGIVWSVSFILMNFFERGNLVSLLNVIAAIALVMNIIVLIKRKDIVATEENPIKFGYIWVGFVLLIPFLIIGVLLGY